VPPGCLRVKLELVIVVASMSAANVAVTLVVIGTFVSASGGEVEATFGSAGLSSTIPGTGVAGATPMSSNTFVAVCWIRESGSPSPSAFNASPRTQWFEPVAYTSAPLAAVYLAEFEVAEPVV